MTHRLSDDRFNAVMSLAHVIDNAALAQRKILRGQYSETQSAIRAICAELDRVQLISIQLCEES